MNVGKNIICIAAISVGLLSLSDCGGYRGKEDNINVKTEISRADTNEIKEISFIQTSPMKYRKTLNPYKDNEFYIYKDNVSYQATESRVMSPDKVSEGCTLIIGSEEGEKIFFDSDNDGVIGNRDADYYLEKKNERIDKKIQKRGTYLFNEDTKNLEHYCEFSDTSAFTKRMIEKGQEKLKIEVTPMYRETLQSMEAVYRKRMINTRMDLEKHVNFGYRNITVPTNGFKGEELMLKLENGCEAYIFRETDAMTVEIRRDGKLVESYVSDCVRLCEPGRYSNYGNAVNEGGYISHRVIEHSNSIFSKSTELLNKYRGIHENNMIKKL